LIGRLPREARPIALATVTAVAAGDTLHVALHALAVPLPHHLFHIVFIGGAALVFWIWVALDVSRHGAPRFSWRL
jgi:hypothetical protein